MELFLVVLFIIACALCWGSFLNVVAYRISFDKPLLTKRSKCQSCSQTIIWYDNIPIISWFTLKGKCRHCKSPISMIYPFVEFLTAAVIAGLCVKFFLPAYRALSIGTLFTFTNTLSTQHYNLLYFFAYTIFFTALILAITTDLFALVIAQIFTLWLIPIGLVFSYLNILPINLFESITGALLGYGVLWLINVIFKTITKKEGIGIGDMELLAMIGAFIGPVGVWSSLILGTTAGLFIGSGYLLITHKNKNTRIPFAPFLAGGAIAFVFFKSALVMFFLY